MSSSKPFKYPKGLRLDETEATFVEGTLLGVAEGAKKSGDSKLFNTAMGLAQRVKQSSMHAQGVSPELQQRLQKGLERAVSSNNPELAQRAMENFLATMVRLHPDPARALSQYVVAYVNQAVSQAIGPATEQAGLHSASAVLELMEVKVEGMRDDYDLEGYPDPEDLVAFLLQWIAVGSKQLAKGDEPWIGDEHIERARAEAEAESDDEG